MKHSRRVQKLAAKMHAIGTGAMRRHQGGAFQMVPAFRKLDSAHRAGWLGLAEYVDSLTRKPRRNGGAS